MIRTARSKIASKVAKIELTDDFHYAKWLRKPRIITPEVKSLYYSEVLDDFPIEQLKTPNNLKLKFKLLSSETPGIRQKYLLEKPRAYLIFFGLTKPQLFTLKESLLADCTIYDLTSGLPQVPKIFDQSSIFIVKPALVQDQSAKFIAKPKSTIDKSSVLIDNVISTFSNDISFSDIPVKEIPLLINPPEVTDHLANLVPEIYNIELLNVEKFDNSIFESKSVEVEKFNEPFVIKIDVPGIDDIINSATSSYSIPFEEIPQADVKFYSPSFEIAHPVFKVKIDLPKTVVKKVVVKQKNLDPVVIDALNDPNISDAAKTEVLSLLSSYRELSWVEYSSNFNALNNHQRDSGEFLSSNNFAMLHDELGYEKFNQTSAAIGYLNKKGNVKSVLLISDSNRFKEYWSISLKSFAKEIKIKKVEPGTTKRIKGNSVIWFLDIGDIGKIDVKDFDRLDLVLFDEMINIKSSSEQIDNIINKIEPSYIWFLSAIINEKHSKKFLEEFKFAQKVEFNFFGKTLEEIQEDNPVVTINNIWLQLDEMQLFEYSEAMAQAKDELTKLFDSPNPLRFQSNIFSIIHKLKQILNFSAFRNISPKANLLIEQVEAIQRNKKKAVIFTQYDVNGIKKIEKALEANNVKFVAGRNGMSTEELKNSLNTFYDRREVAVFLTNLKPSRLKLNLKKVPYIINFDQWWNPITLWQNEDDLSINNPVEVPVIMWNYNIRDVFEEDLQRIIIEKGFNNRYLFDNLKSETLSELMTPEDWLSVFGLNDQYKKVLNSERSKMLTKLHSIDLNSYKGIIKYFFSYLGYRDISIMDIDDEPMFYIIGTARKGTTLVNLHGKCLLTTDVKKEDYEEVIHFKPASNEIKRKFVLTNGEFSERIVNGTMYIDGKDLANFILTLGLKSQVIKRK